MSNTAGTVAITGAYGYLGSVIRSAFQADGWRTIALVRSPRVGDDALEYELRSGLDADSLRRVDVLVHCAYDLTLVERREIEEVNVRGTERLLAAAREAGVSRTIVISSIAAYPGTLQQYGIAKLEIEEIARRHGAVIVRPGLVYGPRSGGMVGSLKRLVSLPLIPVPSPTHQFLVYEEDLAEIVRSIAVVASPPDRPLVVAHSEAVPLSALLEGLMAPGRRRALIPAPWRLAYAALRTAEAVGLRLPFRSDSMWGLAHPPAPPDPTALIALGLAVRPFAAGSL